MSWRVIADDSLRDKVTPIIKHINKGIRENQFTLPEIGAWGLLLGKAGMALYRAYYEKFEIVQDLTREDSIDYLQQLQQSFEEVSDLEDPNNFNFGYGMSGVLWAFTHLINNGFIEGKLEDVLDESMYELSQKFSERVLAIGEYDAFYGGLGPIHFLLEAGKKEYLKDIVHALDRISIRENENASWYWQIKLSKYNLGLAHGVPSIIVFLSFIYKLNIERALCLDLINKAINWLHSVKQTPPVDGRQYPTIITPHERGPFTHLKWCYGELSVAIAVFLAGKNLQEKSIEAQGLALALDCAERTHEASTIKYAHLCHGTAGLGHVFNRLYQITNNEKFKNAALFWLNETADRFNKDFFMGYRDDPGTDSAALLDGASGIALAFISAISSIEPKWDRVLLLS